MYKVVDCVSLCSNSSCVPGNLLSLYDDRAGSRSCSKYELLDILRSRQKLSAIKFAAHPSSGVNHFQERLMEM